MTKQKAISLLRNALQHAASISLSKTPACDWRDVKAILETRIHELSR